MAGTEPEPAKPSSTQAVLEAANDEMILLPELDASEYLKSLDQPYSRFGVSPVLRIPGLLISSLFITIPLGAYRGANLSGLQFLAENSHRLPGNVQGWYFYHKRKNYVMMFNAMKMSFSFTVQGLAFTAGLFGIEAALDTARGQVDFLNTTAGAGFVGYLYARRHKLPWRQVKSTIKTGAKMGMVYGLAQDLVRSFDGRTWYVNLIKDTFLNEDEQQDGPPPTLEAK
ncbi:hypothetical protein BZA70DRAFT_291012 [Myxozyma melibiosi]|uniref:Uncharacterized protein n=1 Tax=Myxozyma melibiosi TaxID=54550 RepID=A0ABR1F298_9ASCO